VREAADALGYVYNRGAADLRRQASNTIGTVINDLTNPFFAELLVGLERSLAEHGYVTLMAHTGEDLTTQERVLASMREHQAAGLILCPAFGTPEELLQRILWWRIPVLIVVRPVGDEGFDFAGSDNEAGTYAATKHLAERGHRRIAFLGRVGGGPVYELRRRGFARAMGEHGLAVEDEWLIDIPPTREGGRAGVRAALALRNRPTAAICYNDIVAFGALSELGEQGLRAGSDFSIVGFDGIADGAHSNPPLTTVSVNPERRKSPSDAPAGSGERAAALSGAATAHRAPVVRLGRGDQAGDTGDAGTGTLTSGSSIGPLAVAAMRHCSARREQLRLLEV